MTASGTIDLMAVKNDYQFHLNDAPSDKFMQWIRTNTKKSDIFLAKQELFDPITLSGRYNYLGHDYYLSVMGYNITQRKLFTKTFFEAHSLETVSKMRKEKIKYLAIPNKPVSDFSYKIDMMFLKGHLFKSYEDNDVIVFKL